MKYVIIAKGRHDHQIEVLDKNKRWCKNTEFPLRFDNKEDAEAIAQDLNESYPNANREFKVVIEEETID